MRDNRVRFVASGLTLSRATKIAQTEVQKDIQVEVAKIQKAANKKVPLQGLRRTGNAFLGKVGIIDPALRKAVKRSLPAFAEKRTHDARHVTEVVKRLLPAETRARSPKDEDHRYGLAAVTAASFLYGSGESNFSRSGRKKKTFVTEANDLHAREQGREAGEKISRRIQARASELAAKNSPRIERRLQTTLNSFPDAAKTAPIKQKPHLLLAMLEASKNARSSQDACYIAKQIGRLRVNPRHLGIQIKRPDIATAIADLKGTVNETRLFKDRSRFKRILVRIGEGAARHDERKTVKKKQLRDQITHLRREQKGEEIAAKNNIAFDYSLNGVLRREREERAQRYDRQVALSPKGCVSYDYSRYNAQAARLTRQALRHAAKGHRESSKL